MLRREVHPHSHKAKRIVRSNASNCMMTSYCLGWNKQRSQYRGGHLSSQPGSHASVPKQTVGLSTLSFDMVLIYFLDAQVPSGRSLPTVPELIILYKINSYMLPRKDPLRDPLWRQQADSRLSANLPFYQSYIE